MRPALRPSERPPCSGKPVRDPLDWYVVEGAWADRADLVESEMKAIHERADQDARESSESIGGIYKKGTTKLQRVVLAP